MNKTYCTCIRIMNSQQLIHLQYVTGGLIQDFRQMDRHALSGVLKKTYHVTHRCKRLK